MSTDNRQLTDVFKELQQTRMEYEQENQKKKKHSYQNNSKKTFTISIIFIFLLILTFLVIIGAGSISAKDDTLKLHSPGSGKKDSISIEINRHRLNAHNIITSNASLETIKQQVIEEQDIPFETLYTDRSTLPKGEEVILQEGTNGKKNVTFVRSFINSELSEEIILKEEKTLDFLPQIVDKGTSQFLFNIKAHLNDMLYLKNDSILYEGMDTNSSVVAEIPKFLDVKLVDLPSEEWCKVSYDGIDGYILSKNLTSANVSPNIPEKCRIKKLLLKLDKQMPLNHSSGLELDDFKKIFTGLSSDYDNVFYNNYETFYNIDKKYNINGIFLASIAIHESNWGTSQIAKEKKNLFGYGSYDDTPFESSYEFEDYKDSIELVAKVMVKYYLNPVGTKIYDDEYALATYYNGSTVEDVNIRYASDDNWSEKVYSYMEMLYKRLE